MGPCLRGAELAPGPGAVAAGHIRRGEITLTRLTGAGRTGHLPQPMTTHSPQPNLGPWTQASCILRASPTPLDIFLVQGPPHQPQKVSTAILYLPLAGFLPLCFPVPFFCLPAGPHLLPLHPCSSSPHAAHTRLSPGPPEMPGLHASSTSCLLLSRVLFSPLLPGTTLWLPKH